MEGKESAASGADLAKLRLAIRQLQELCTKLTDAAKNKLRPVSSKFKTLLAEEETYAGVADRVRKSATAIETFFRAREKGDLALRSFTNSLSYLREAQSVEEISTLTRFTLLPDYSKYLDANTRFLHDYEFELANMKEGIDTLIDFAGEVHKIGIWFRELLDFDLVRKEDNLLRMLTAIQKLDLNLFTKLYEETERKLKTDDNVSTATRQ